MNEPIMDATAKVVQAFVSNNPIPPERVPDLIRDVGSAFAGTEQVPEPEHIPAVNPARSVRHDHIVSLIDGKPYKMLRRHLSIRGLTPDEYRKRFNLRPDYPMVARAYSEKRRQLAIENGLGRKPS